MLYYLGAKFILGEKNDQLLLFSYHVLILWGRINEINILRSNLHDDGSYTKEINAEGTEYPKKHACEFFFTYMLVNRALRIEKWHILACPKCHIITNKGCTWLNIQSVPFTKGSTKEEWPRNMHQTITPCGNTLFLENNRSLEYSSESKTHRRNRHF